MFYLIKSRETSINIASLCDVVKHFADVFIVKIYCLNIQLRRKILFIALLIMIGSF